MLNRIPGWEEAALMIYHHHERPDGQGYPQQLGRTKICPGAKLIAIADSFFSITNTRADRTHKRSILRAVSEINAYSGTQFDEETVDAFNQMIKHTYTKSNNDCQVTAYKNDSND